MSHQFGFNQTLFLHPLYNHVYNQVWGLVNSLQNGVCSSVWRLLLQHLHVHKFETSGWVSLC